MLKPDFSGWSSFVKNMLLNILKNAKAGSLQVIAKKFLKRFESDTREEATRWASSRAIAIDEYCRSVNMVLWEETQNECTRIKADAEKILRHLPIKLGGGGAFPLLYFLVRLHKPAVVVETGVAAGWSSRAILEALYRNQHGRLYSSDFPYFRFDDPEQYIGCIVPDRCRSVWTLDTRGDQYALTSFVQQINSIDLLHYDSDKSVSGRQFAMKSLAVKLSDDCIIMMDDINDNLFFKNYVEENEADPKVFEFEGKYIGVLGLS
jgi:predicted O-methyltransferase YrrM